MAKDTNRAQRIRLGLGLVMWADSRVECGGLVINIYEICKGQVAASGQGDMKYHLNKMAGSPADPQTLSSLMST